MSRRTRKLPCGQIVAVCAILAFTGCGDGKSGPAEAPYTPPPVTLPAEPKVDPQATARVAENLPFFR